MSDQLQSFRTQATASAPTAVPSNTLANANGTAFLLFNSDWLKVQSIIASCLALPIDQGDFTTKYGTFADQAQVTGCLNAMQAVQSLGTTMGNATQLLAEIAANPNYVSGPTPPPEIYAHCIWLAGQINNAASSFHLTYSSLSEIFTGDPATDAAALRTVLTGPGGLQSLAAQVLGYTQALQTKLGTFQTAFTPDVTTILSYCTANSQILQDAQAIATLDAANITSLQASAASAYKEWEDYTISALTVSIGLMVLSGGLLWPAAAAAGGALGYEAAKEMAEYNADMALISVDTADEVQKNQLVTDLTGLSNLLPGTQSALQNFATQLTIIEGVWLDQNQQLTNIAALDDATLGNLPLITQKLDLLKAQAQWQTISNNTSGFTTNCLVTYLTTTQFPNPIPAS